MLDSARTVAFGALALVAVAVVHAPSAAGRPAAAPPASAQRGTAPLLFERNVGQTDPSVAFLAHVGGATAFVTSSGLVVAAAPARTAEVEPRRARGGERPEHAAASTRPASVVRITLDGATERPPVGVEPRSARVNYMRGSDPTRWVLGVPTFAAVVATEAYDGIDVRYEGDGGALATEIVADAGADVERVRFRVEGADAVDVEPDGSLVVRSGDGVWRQPAPRVVRRGSGGERTLSGAFEVADGEVRIVERAAKTEAPASVGPSLDYSTYLGGGDGTTVSQTTAENVAVDGSGFAYLVGETTAIDLPATAGGEQPALRGYQDVFLTKIAPDGASALWTTYLGGSDLDTASDVAIDASGAAYVTGYTQSLDFPKTATVAYGHPSYPNGPDAFVAKVSADGTTLAYSVVLGGEGWDAPAAVAVDGIGAASVAVYTAFTDGNQTIPFPTTPGAFDPTGSNGRATTAVFKVNAAGTALVYSTFLGAPGDIPYDLDADALGAAYVTGTATSPQGSFPTTPGAFERTRRGNSDVFVTKLASSGASLSYSTLLGSNDQDDAVSLDVDASGRAVVLGFTTSTVAPLFPTTPGAFQRTGNGPFVTEFDPSGSSLVFSTLVSQGFPSITTPFLEAVRLDSAGAAHIMGTKHDASGFGIALATVSSDGAGISPALDFGGPGVEFGRGLAADAAGAVYVCGYTFSAGFPTTAGALDTSLTSEQAGFLAKFAPGASTPTYSTFVEGHFAQSVDDVGAGIAVDDAGSAYVVGRTMSTDFPVEGFDTDLGGSVDAFVTKLSPAGDGLVYSTYLGGSVSSGGDYATGIALGADGAAYVTGYTQSTDFPTTPGAYDRSLGGSGQDAFVAKLSPAGDELVYSTFLGGDVPNSSAERGVSVAVDATGAATVAGTTDDPSFPTTAGAYDTSYAGLTDAFVSKLSPAGSSLVYSTFLGSSGEEAVGGVALGQNGSAYVAGMTRSTGASTPYPTTPGALDRTPSGDGDAFVTHLSPNGSSLVYSTFLGGSDYDEATGIAVDATGAVYAAGTTISQDFPVVSAYDPTVNDFRQGDVFVAKLAAAGDALVYSTYLGGMLADHVYGLAVDGGGRAAVVGQTGSVDAANGPYPTTPNALFVTPPGLPDSFVSILGPDGSTLAYSTFFGGTTGTESALAAAFDSAGALYFTGVAYSYDLPLVNPYQARRNGALDVFVTKLTVPTATRDTPGVYVPATGAWFLRDANAGGPADTVFAYGPAGGGTVPLRGDWNGDGVDTPGVYVTATGAFFLKNSNAPGPADLVFAFGGGGSGVFPLSGDWDGDGSDSVGLYVPATGTFFLRNTNSAGPADVAFAFGPPSSTARAVMGDWDGDGSDTAGIYLAASGTFFLKNANAPGPADFAFTYGPPGARAIAGDWNADGFDTVGVYIPGSGAWFLRNANAGGAADVAFVYGPPNAVPLAGDWDGD